MALKFRWTKSGKDKQRRDELAGWKTLESTCAGTPAAAAQLNAVVTGRDGDGNPTELNTSNPNYAQWKEAHKLATKRARLDRQREQRAQATLMPSPGPNLPCRVKYGLNLRDTLRIAILSEATSTNNGTTIGGKNRRTTAQLMAHLKKVLGAIEDELRVVSRHRQDHDLRAAGRPPIQVFVASEWYFRRHDRPHTQAERNAILQQLEGLSRNFPDWLLIPGTIYWTPDAIVNPTVRVFNQAVVLYAGGVVITRTKRNPQDIHDDKAYHERWGPDAVGALPATVLPATLNVAHTNHRGREWCFDICRDHPVGEAMQHYVGAAGAHIYVLTSNGTTIRDNFLPTRNNGIAIYCDGATNSRYVYTVTRPTPLTNAGIVNDWNNYWTSFQNERPASINMYHALSEQDVHKRDPAYQPFRQRYDAVFANPSSDALLRAAAHGNVAANPPPATPAGGAMFMNQAQPLREEGLRIQHILGHGSVPTGTAISAAENIVMTNYANECMNAVAALHTMALHRGAVDNHKQTFEATSNATKAATGNQVALTRFPRLTLYNLIDAP